MRFVIALALVLSITPGVFEVVESVVHLVAHHDLPDHDTRDGDCTEHTCTPLAHHCGCHSAMTGHLWSRSIDLDSIDHVGSIDPDAISRVFGRTFDPPPLRPPIV